MPTLMAPSINPCLVRALEPCVYEFEELGLLRSPDVPWVAKWGSQVIPTLLFLGLVCWHCSKLKLARVACTCHCNEVPQLGTEIEYAAVSSCDCWWKF